MWLSPDAAAPGGPGSFQKLECGISHKPHHWCQLSAPRGQGGGGKGEEVGFLSRVVWELAERGSLLVRPVLALPGSRETSRAKEGNNPQTLKLSWHHSNVLLSRANLIVSSPKLLRSL